MNSKKLPAMQFYPGDWRKDPCLQACSLTARGLWMEMLCLMHESIQRGHLIFKTGVPMDEQQLGRVAGITGDECKKLLNELENAGVLSIGADNEYVCRRMVRDEAKREGMREGGRKGGLIASANRKARASSSSSTSSSTSSSKKDIPKKVVSASEYHVLMQDADVRHVLDCIPKNRKMAVKTIVSSVANALLEIDSFAEPPSENLSVWLGERIVDYYKSPEGTGKFFRSPSRWLDDGGYLEPEETWSARSEETSKF